MGLANFLCFVLSGTRVRCLFIVHRLILCFSTCLCSSYIKKKKKSPWNLLPGKPLVICSIIKNKMRHIEAAGRRVSASDILLGRGQACDPSTSHPRTHARTQGGTHVCEVTIQLFATLCPYVAETIQISLGPPL